MARRILIAAGGSGGHIFPALSLADELGKLEETEVAFAGGGLTTNPFFDREKIPFYDISYGKLFVKHPLYFLKGVIAMCKGILESRDLLKKYRPHIVVGFGSYHSFPLLAAAKMSGVSYALYTADSIPGKVVRLFSKGSLVTGVHFPAAAGRLRGHAQLVRMPLRAGIKKGAVSASLARDHFGLDPEKETVLIFGGSQGAKGLNRLVLEAAKLLPKHLQFLHLCGSGKELDHLSAVYKSHGLKAYVAPFEKRMDIAWSAASYAILRAGASSIAEMAEYEIPALLVPYPHAADKHQELNAVYIAESKGAALWAQEEELTGELFAKQLQQLMVKQQELKKALAHLKKSGEALEFSSVIMTLLNNK